MRITCDLGGMYKFLALVRVEGYPVACPCPAFWGSVVKALRLQILARLILRFVVDLSRFA